MAIDAPCQRFGDATVVAWSLVKALLRVSPGPATARAGPLDDPIECRYSERVCTGAWLVNLARMGIAQWCDS